MTKSKGVLDKNKETASDLTLKIENTLNSFGIKGRIEAVTFVKSHTLLSLSLSAGVRVEEVESLSRTIATAVASPTGKVEMIVPIPGTSYIGIKVPTVK